MAIDFLVHPEYAYRELYTGRSRKVFQDYLDALIDFTQKSIYPVLITNGIDLAFSRLIQKERIFRSMKHSEGNTIFETGEIYHDDLDRFYSLIEESGEKYFHIHGSYFGHCTLDLALQLIDYFHLGEIGYDAFGNVLFKPSTNHPIKIRYGIVLAKNSDNPRQVNFQSTDDENINNYLITDKTKIFVF